MNHNPTPDVETMHWIRTERLLAQSCELLDQERFEEWLDLFTEDARYEATTWSPELNRDQVWLRLNKAELASLVRNVNNHIRDRATRSHLARLVELVPNGHSNRYNSTARFVLLRTDEAGETSVYLTGRYLDVVQVEGDVFRLAARHVRLDTRLFAIGSHVPV